MNTSQYCSCGLLLLKSCNQKLEFFCSSHYHVSKLHHIPWDFPDLEYAHLLADIIYEVKRVIKMSCDVMDIFPVYRCYKRIVKALDNCLFNIISFPFEPL